MMRMTRSGCFFRRFSGIWKSLMVLPVEVFIVFRVMFFVLFF